VVDARQILQGYYLLVYYVVVTYVVITHYGVKCATKYAVSTQ